MLAYADRSVSLGYGRIEERRNHRKQPIGAFDKRNVRRTREHGELGIREADGIAGDATTEQPKQLYSVLRTDDIGISDDEQGGRFVLTTNRSSHQPGAGATLLVYRSSCGVLMWWA